MYALCFHDDFQVGKCRAFIQIFEIMGTKKGPLAALKYFFRKAQLKLFLDLRFLPFPAA